MRIELNASHSIHPQRDEKTTLRQGLARFPLKYWKTKKLVDTARTGIVIRRYEQRGVLPRAGWPPRPA